MAGPQSGQPKRCHYEVLGLPRDCSIDDVKSAFKRLALRLHPDKLPPDSSAAQREAAAAAFVELRAAHDVLTDPRERAYYDSHRSQILLADFSTSGDFLPDELFAYFSASAFSGFGDSGRGFFKVYGDVFNKIYGNEVKFAQRMGMASDEVPPPPAIGNLDSDYVQVTAFYGYWGGFSTVMDFNWVDEYDAAAGANRRSRRLMEDENKKVRKKARREYNDTVRALTAFVKKRDKRVVDMVLKKKAEDERRKREELERKRQEDQKRAETLKRYVEPEWTKVGEDEDVCSSEDDDSKKKDELYCVACSKKFKSEKQWKNHEQSRKHREKVAELRSAFAEEERSLGKDEDDVEEVDDVFEDVEVDLAYDAPSGLGSDCGEEIGKELNSNLHLDDKDNGDEELVSTNQVNLFDVLDDDGQENTDNEEITHGRNKNNIHVKQDGPSVSNLDNSEGQSQNFAASKRNRNRKQAGKETTEESTSGIEFIQQVDEASSLDCEPHDLEHEMNGNVARALSSDESLSSHQQAEKIQGSKRKINKKKLGKKDTSFDQKNQSKASKQQETSSDVHKTPSCEACGKLFDSRNKLFEHLESTGHAKVKGKKGRR